MRRELPVPFAGIPDIRLGDVPDAVVAGIGDDRGMAGAASTVLVVEDERRIRELVRGYLEHAGFGVVTAPTGADALALATRSECESVDLG